MTEQGERINAKYGLRGISMRTLEQTTSALLYNLAMPIPPADDPDWNQIMQTVADESHRAYRALTEESGIFERYFRAATPIDAIERLGMSAEGSTDVGSPDSPGVSARHWETAWTQNRCLMPAWYGFAAGVNSAISSHGEPAVKRMFEESHFARVLLSDIELTLAKADLETAARYSELAGDLHLSVFAEIHREYEQSIDAVLRLSGTSKLLESSAALRRAIRLRNPYVDPMNYLQVDLLKRWRASNRRDDAVLKALQASINGIAHGMQNTN
jgi:phosphoenolpyruvate carboxylase